MCDDVWGFGLIRTATISVASSRVYGVGGYSGGFDVVRIKIGGGCHESRKKTKKS